MLLWYQVIQIISFKMEDQAAGKITPSNPPVDSPKKVFNPIGTESQWSLGWNNSKDTSNRPNNSKGLKAYHNQSSIVLGEGQSSTWKNQQPTKSQVKKHAAQEKPVWNYDPKKAGKTTMVLGNDKPDYRKKDEVYKQRTATTLTNSRRK